MSKLTLVCPTCKGKGRISFTGVYADTLELLRAQKEPINGAALARLHGVNPTAMNNRLTWLEHHRFAVGFRYGSEKRWRAV